MAGLDGSGAGASRAFANTPDAAARARRFVAAQIGDVPRAVADDIALMVSELASNCVRHAVSAFTVVVERTGDQLRVEVTDAGTGSPTVRSPPPSELTGRGLQIVQEVARSFGIRETEGSPGKTVWFVVDLGLPAVERVERRDRSTPHDRRISS